MHCHRQTLPWCPVALTAIKKSCVKLPLVICCQIAVATTAVAEPWKPPQLTSLPQIIGLPELLIDANGRRITTPDAWEERRADIAAMIQHFEYGHLPPRPDKVWATDIERHPFHAANVVGLEELLTLRIGSKQNLPLKISIHWPTSFDGPRPVIVTEVHRITDMPCIPMFLQAGFVFVQYQREDLDPDLPNVIGPAQTAYPDFDWATLAVWAWGAMRVVDFLETHPNVDRKCIAITGHSRGGKAALLAGALDERFALVAPNGSGCGGAGCFRDSTSKNETLSQITDPQRFHYWFHPRLRWFADRTDRLPIDQHFVKALVAPRALLCTEARGDLWSNPAGTRRTSIAARSAYTLLEAEDRIALSFRDGQHDQTLADWKTLLAFAKWQFLGKRPNAQTSFWDTE